MTKTIPLLSILRSAVLSILAWAFASAFLHWAYQSIPALNAVLSIFLRYPINLMTKVGVGFAVGALALLLYAKPTRDLTTVQLWGLVIFSALGMFVYDFSLIRPYRLLGLNFGPFMLVGLVAGIFLCGRKNWR